MLGENLEQPTSVTLLCASCSVALALFGRGPQRIPRLPRSMSNTLHGEIDFSTAYSPEDSAAIVTRLAFGQTRCPQPQTLDIEMAAFASDKNTPPRFATKMVLQVCSRARHHLYNLDRLWLDMFPAIPKLGPTLSI